MAGGMLRCLLTIALIASVCSANAPASSSIICNVQITDLLECLPAISGAHPPPPTRTCCKLIHKVDLPCLCRYKPQLAKFGANPAAAMALPKTCGIKYTPKC